MTAARNPASRRRQRGVYAVEFAFVFLVFFTLLYAIICYSILFTMRISLQNAAEDGARAALRYQADLPGREAKAKEVAQTQAAGLLPVAPTVEAKVCQVVGGNCTAGRTCGAAWESRCQVIVTVTASSMGQMLPPLPGFAVPDRIVGQASMLLDGRAL